MWFGAYGRNRDKNLSESEHELNKWCRFIAVVEKLLDS